MHRTPRVEPCAAEHTRSLHGPLGGERVAGHEPRALEDTNLPERLAAAHRESGGGLRNDSLHDRLVDPHRTDHAARRHEAHGRVPIADLYAGVDMARAHDGNAPV